MWRYRTAPDRRCQPDPSQHQQQSRVCRPRGLRRLPLKPRDQTTFGRNLFRVVQVPVLVLMPVLATGETPPPARYPRQLDTASLGVEEERVRRGSKWRRLYLTTSHRCARVPLSSTSVPSSGFRACLASAVLLLGLERELPRGESRRDAYNELQIKINRVMIVLDLFPGNIAGRVFRFWSEQDALYHVPHTSVGAIFAGGLSAALQSRRCKRGDTFQNSCMHFA